MLASQIIISSKTNKWIKLCMSIHKGNGKEENCFLAEGTKVIQALSCKLKPEILLTSESFAPKVAELTEFKQISIQIVSDQLWPKVCSLDSPVQLIGIFRRPQQNLVSLKSASELLVLDRIQDPGNMGTIIRTAVASGWKNLICLKGSVDPFSPKVVRASAGAIGALNIFTDLTNVQLLEVLEEQFTTVLTSSHSKVEVKDLHLPPNAKPCLVLGNEGGGVDLTLKNENSFTVKIPMRQDESLESLNVAIAGALLMYKLKGLI